jgi:hypothetical protein
LPKEWAIHGEEAKAAAKQINEKNKERIQGALSFMAPVWLLGDLAGSPPP